MYVSYGWADGYQNGENYNVSFGKYIKPYKDKVTIETQD